MECDNNYTPIITHEYAEALNERIQREVDASLFLCYNYTPTKIPTLHKDGYFLTSIQDLYKFAIDSGIIIKNTTNKNVFKKTQVIFQPSSKLIKKYCDEISVLRAYLDHNQNDNLIEDKKIIDSFNLWINNVIQKDSPQTDSDYANLVLQLEKTAKGLQNALNDFIKYIKNSPQKEQIISEWTDAILFWYSNNISKRIYIQQLMIKFKLNGKREIDELLKKVFDNKINYCKNLMDNIDSQIEEMQKMSDTSEDEKKEAIAALSELKENQNNELEKMNEKKTRYNTYTDMYFCDLENQLRETLSILKNEGKSYTLLPESLIQEDIDRNLGGIVI